MQLTNTYRRTLFTPEAIAAAKTEFDRLFNRPKRSTSTTLNVSLGDETWAHDNESEFFADYRRDPELATYRVMIHDEPRAMLAFHFFGEQTDVTVQGDERAKILSVFEIVDRHAPKCRIPEPPKEPKQPPSKPVVFIGHGHSTCWRDLKDHLHEKHGYQVEAYEIGARAGHVVRDILDDMLTRSSFAVLVLTGEDTTADGSLRARQNVVHETGLFQGRLGFSRAIVLLEKGVEEFSNIEGIEQIRFAKGNIRETFGDILATLKREFDES